MGSSKQTKRFNPYHSQLPRHQFKGFRRLPLRAQNFHQQPLSTNSFDQSSESHIINELRATINIANNDHDSYIHNFASLYSMSGSQFNVFRHLSRPSSVESVHDAVYFVPVGEPRESAQHVSGAPENPHDTAYFVPASDPCESRHHAFEAPGNAHDAFHFVPVSESSESTHHASWTLEPYSYLPTIPNLQHSSVDAYHLRHDNSTAQWLLNDYAQPPYDRVLNALTATNPSSIPLRNPPIRRSASPFNNSSPSPFTYSSTDCGVTSFSSGISSASDFGDMSEATETPWVGHPVQTDDETRELPYSELIWQCMMETEEKGKVLQDIYQWFETRGDKRWISNRDGCKNSVRHNLSMNPAFQKGSMRNPDNPKKTMWYLSDQAIAEGKVYPTTRGRNEPKKQPQRNRRSPAPQRQISGAKGGHAARRSAHEKRKQNANARSARDSSTSARASPQLRRSRRRTARASNVTHPSLPPVHGSSFNINPSLPHEVTSAPYYNVTPTPVMPSIYVGHPEQQHFVDHSLAHEAITPPYCNATSTSDVPSKYMEYPEQQRCTNQVPFQGLSMNLDMYMGYMSDFSEQGSMLDQVELDLLSGNGESTSLLAVNDYRSPPQDMQHQSFQLQSTATQASQQDTLGLSTEVEVAMMAASASMFSAYPRGADFQDWLQQEQIASRYRPIHADCDEIDIGWPQNYTQNTQYHQSPVPDSESVQPSSGNEGKDKPTTPTFTGPTDHWEQYDQYFNSD